MEKEEEKIDSQEENKQQEIPSFDKNEVFTGGEGLYTRIFQTAEGPKQFTLLVSEGVPYLKMVDARLFVDYTMAGLHRRLDQIQEEEKIEDPRVMFGQYDIRVPVSFILDHFFKPKPRTGSKK